MLLEEEKVGVNSVTPSTNDTCQGTLEFQATATVLKTSDASRVPIGTVLYANRPRSVAYTISGAKGEVIDLISTSPGTIASGTAHKQSND